MIKLPSQTIIKKPVSTALGENEVKPGRSAHALSGTAEDIAIKAKDIITAPSGAEPERGNSLPVATRTEMHTVETTPATPAIAKPILPVAKRLSIAEMILANKAALRHDDKVIEKIEQKLNPQSTAVTVPVVGLKHIIEAKKNEFEKQYRDNSAGNDSTSIVKSLNQGGKQIDLDASQRAAIEGLLTEQFACLIGAAGTGKTTITRMLLEQIEDLIGTVVRVSVDKDGKEVKIYHLGLCVCAFTGRATEQIKKALPAKYHNVTGTIHGDKCLTYVPEFYDDIDANGMVKEKQRFVPTYTKDFKLPYKLFIIDEAGMLSVELWNILRDAMTEDAKVILIGDINQLPPVYGRSILGYAMTKWPTFELTTVHRQAQDNPIIANAHRILRGETPVAVKNRFDLHDVGDKGSIGTFAETMDMIKYLHKNKSFEPHTDGFIMPQNVSQLGQIAFNEELAIYFNPNNRRQMIKTGDGMAHYAVDDKVMILKNDKERNLTNGMVGRIVGININGNFKDTKSDISQLQLESMKSAKMDAIDNLEDHISSVMKMDMDKVETKNTANSRMQRPASHVLIVRFGDFSAEKPNDISFSTAGEYSKIAHAYAITCHKSQGGEYPTVIILLHSANSRMLSREWLYTAVTRGQVRDIIVFNKRGLQMALSNQRIKGTTLQEKINSFIKASAEDAGNDNAIIPNLPEAQIWKPKDAIIYDEPLSENINPRGKTAYVAPKAEAEIKPAKTNNISIEYFISNEIKNYGDDQMKKYWNESKQIFGEEIGAEPYLSYRLQKRTKLGICQTGNNCIKLNGLYCALADTNPSIKKEMFEATLLHEIAHMIAFRMGGDRGHGAGWKMTMKMLKQKPDVYYDEDAGTLPDWAAGLKGLLEERARQLEDQGAEINWDEE